MQAHVMVVTIGNRDESTYIVWTFGTTLKFN